MAQMRFDSIEMLANSPWFAPTVMAGKTEEVIREFAGVTDLLGILPMRPGKLPFTFRDEIRQNVLTIAPRVSSAQDTPIDTMPYIDQVFVAYEARFGHVISERNADQAPDEINLSQRASHRIGRAIANRIFYELFKVFRAFDNTAAAARFPAPTVKWSDPGSDPLADIELMRNYIGNLTGESLDFLIMSRSINSVLKIHPDVTTRNRNNLNAEFRNGDLVGLMGLTIVIIPEVVFTLPNGTVVPMYAPVTTLDGKIHTNYVIGGVGGRNLGYSGAVATANPDGDGQAPIMRNYADVFNRRFGVMGFVEMVHVIQDWFSVTLIDGCI